MRIEDRYALDNARWFEAWLDTPLAAPQGCRTPEEATRRPGCAVRSRERDPSSVVFSVHYGKLVTFDEVADRVLVRGHDSEASPRFVWEGTIREYLTLWECD